MASERKVWIVVFPDFQSLDALGPIEVFHGATVAARARGRRRGYDITLVGPRAGAVRSSSGVDLLVERGFGPVRTDIDLLLVAGGSGARRAAQAPETQRFIRRAAARARRVASVCTGAFVLAGAGLLDGRRATTHWAHADRLARAHPEVRVEPDPIYLRDGSVYTSAGVTAGMDLALHLVREDLGPELALLVARHLVMYMHRPGGQTQFSEPLRLQASLREALPDLREHLVDHLDEDLSVEALARRVGMSPRHFARVFRRETGETPAVYVERLRVEAARGLLEQTELDLVSVAEGVGFGSVETLRRAFARRLGVSPRDYRRSFRAA